jgi:hypothetical protein
VSLQSKLYFADVGPFGRMTRQLRYELNSARSFIQLGSSRVTTWRITCPHPEAYLAKEGRAGAPSKYFCIGGLLIVLQAWWILRENDGDYTSCFTQIRTVSSLRMSQTGEFFSLGLSDVWEPESLD